MTLVVQNALQEVLDKVFAGKDRAALLESLLHQLLAAEGSSPLVLSLDAAQQLDTSKGVAVTVSEDLTVRITPTAAEEPASARHARKAEAA